MKNDLVIGIALNYNQNDYTISCVHSVLKSNYLNFKFILIDNGSTPENVLELEEKLPVDDRFIFKKIKKNRGYIGGMNYGFEVARPLNPKYFVVMNNDIVLDIKAISELVKTSIEFNDKAIVTGKVYHYDQPEMLQLVGFKYTKKRFLDRIKLGNDVLDNGQYDMVQEMDMIDDIVGLYPVELYDEIGGYSDYFWINGEQFDLALRAQKKGYKLIYSPKVKLWHKGSVTFGGRNKNPRLAFWELQGSLILRYIHLDFFNFLTFYFLMVKSIIGTYFKAIRSSISGKENLFKYANAKLRGLLYFHRWAIIKNRNVGYNPYN